ncbi:hypothetical protein C2869_04390 [Saccharobesus litoralis]|uniref:RNA polymerase sigma-70 region 2 domain-containing protein n=1 Tax=Saccharobesus litoralis TaxID=2172099 RepID=A0A2S0VND3_9ALTE|nr:RNA polymerase sigma factor [Saccharobesus litoralis]AWB65723.1 hypothetical protein C2869_04390 [Saccharobesus litoralis]
MSIEQDYELIRLAQNGDVNAFSELVSKYEREIRISLATRLDSHHEAEDLAQETFIVAFRKIKDFVPERPIKYWFKAIALNLLNNHRRKSVPLAVGDAMDLESIIESKIEHKLEVQTESGLYAALTGCLDFLNDSLKKLVIQHYGEGYTIRDLAKMTDTKYSTLTMRLHRVRDKLRNCISDKMAGDS